MSETRIELGEADLSSDEKVLGVTPPPIRLAYEGLIRLVEIGSITYEDALIHHRAMFPETPDSNPDL